MPIGMEHYESFQMTPLPHSGGHPRQPSSIQYSPQLQKRLELTHDNHQLERSHLYRQTYSDLKLSNGNPPKSREEISLVDSNEYIVRKPANGTLLKTDQSKKLSSTEEYFITLDRPPNNSHQGYSNPYSRCRVITLICLMLGILIFICVSIVLFSFTDLLSTDKSCNSKFLCLPKNSNSGKQEVFYSGNQLLPNDTSDPWNLPRLPKDTFPIHYDLTVFIDHKRNFFYGNVTIHFVVKLFTRYIVLHCAPEVSSFYITINLQNVTKW